MKLLFSGIALLLLCTGCSKDSADEKDIRPPVITITSPVNGQTFTNGQSINITGTITDDKYIAETHIHITNNTTGNLLMDVHLYPASAITTFNQSFTAASGIIYKIQVIAKDRAVNEARSSVEVSCN
jgi:Bacterial Ig domain